ncbi:lipid intermediate transporter [Sarotherodon galilaeus]
MAFCLAPMEGVTPEIFASRLAHRLVGKPLEFLLEELRERRKGELEIRTQTKLKHSPPFERNIRSRLKDFFSEMSVSPQETAQSSSKRCQEM